MNIHSRSFVAGLWTSIVVCGVLPLLLYWGFPGQLCAPAASGAVPVLDVGLPEQWLVVTTAFGIKPAYMILSLVLIIWLWRRRSADLAALRWGLIWFLGGEIACAINYLLLGGRSALTDYLHSYGMVVGFSFATYAALEAADFRVIKYSALKERCAALSLCRACIKYEDAPCGLRQLFKWLIPALVIITFMLPTASLKVVSHQTGILGSPQVFCNPLWSQVFESRYCAWLSVLFLVVSWLMLMFKRNDPVSVAKLFFAAAIGPLGFGLMRVFLRAAYSDDLIWANAWEELTEFIFVVGVGCALWTFRQSLFREE